MSEQPFPHYFTLGETDEDMGFVCMTYAGDEENHMALDAGDDGRRRRTRAPGLDSETDTWSTVSSPRGAPQPEHGYNPDLV